MPKFAVHFLIIVFVGLAHIWAYWSAMSRASFDWSALSNFLPFLLIVGSIVGAAAAINSLIGFALLNRADSSVNSMMFALIYIIWFISAFSLYVMNKGVDAYSATLGTFIYMPFHAGVVFIINLFVTMIFKLFAAPEVEQK